MEHYITPISAQRKLKAAKTLGQTAYLYAATGYGKTSFVENHLAARKYIYLNCSDRRWNEEALPRETKTDGRRTVVIDDLHLLDEDRRKLVKDLAARPDVWLILVSRSPVPSWLMPEYVNIGFIVISEKDMRLGKKEIRGYLDSLGLSYTEEGLQYLTDTAEGNGYIVRHAALKMAEGLEPGERMRKEIHDAFARYLEEYIMVQWDSELLEFLMEVSVVEEFTLPLAELITTNRLASVMVQKAMETGNFLFENDGMYRLRPVLLHALRKKAQQSLGEEQIKNRRKSAGVWYEMDGQVSQALEMYEQSGSQGQIRELLIRNARVNPGAGHYYELRRYYLDIGLPHRGSRDVLKIMLRAPAMLLDQGVSLPEFSVTSNIPSTMSGGKDFCKWSRSDRALARTVGPLVERVLGSYGKGLTKIALGESLYEKGADAFEVLTLLSRGQVETECGGRLEIAFSAVGQRVRLMILQGDLRNAGTILSSFQAAVEEQRAVQLMPNIQAMRCRIALYAGDMETVNQWLSTAPDEDKEFITMERYRYFTKARCYLTLGENLKALALLEKLSEYAKLVHRTYVGIEAGLLVAIVRRRLGTEWEPQLKAALDEAESYQFVRVITELGPAILPLLKARSRAGPWFKRVLEETQKTARRYPGYLLPRTAIREDFSDTALKILHLQSDGLSATQIGERLNIKPDTVRYHIKENYRKLRASGKAEAIAAARDLGLI